jgi:hypothetical protein
MNKRQRRATGSAAIALLLMLVPACAALDGVLGDVGGYPDGRSSQIVGEVRSVDSRRGQLQVRDDRSRSNVTLRYDNRTRVTYGRQQYPASALERGDVVRVAVSYDRSGSAWADRVDVRSTARPGRTTAGRVQRVDGTVRAVDTRRGYFALDQNRAATIVVYMPQRASSSDARRFERLRRGDRIRVELRPIGNNQAELVRFR